MGDEIARFRDLAVAIRRHCDEKHSQPRRSVTGAASAKFARECRLHFLDHEKAGMNHPERYVRGLCKRRDEAERRRDLPPPGGFEFCPYIEWLPESFKHPEVSASTTRTALRKAIAEAVRYGSLFSEVEKRLKDLEAAARMLVQYAAPDCFSQPAPEYVEETKEGEILVTGPSLREADSDYIARHKQFAEAIEALAPFIEEHATPVAPFTNKPNGTKQKKRRDRKGVGGRPERYPLKFIREVVDARERDQKHAAKTSQRLPAFPRWLSDYCSGKKIDIRERFPAAEPGEAWSVTANRFWKAAKKRLRDSGD